MTIEQINEFCKDTFIGHLEIEFIEYGADYVKALMPVNQKNINQREFCMEGPLWLWPKQWPVQDR